MTALRLAMCVAVGLGTAAMTGGCEDKKPNQPNPQTGGGGGTQGDKAMKQAQGVAAGVTAGSGTPANVGEAAKTTVDAAKPKVDAAKTTIDDAGTGAGEMMASPVAMAKPMLTKLQDAINGGKLDEAKGYLDKLKSMRDKLPADMQKQYDTLLGLYNSEKAKAAAGANK
ncbi:MAG TPA: hypothetical protein VEA69_21650 [Tepidisphaeraceae bacterium]|nr:hypothetical protein [Tepidisphaeraceae bacterium]